MASGVSLFVQAPGDYRATTGCGRAPVAPGGTCTVSVRFVPTSTGLRTATAAVSDNAPLSPQGARATGYGIGPNSWSPVGPMSSSREEFSATLLPDGQVLMAGGETSADSSLA